jgi:hypothetical protein
MATAENPDRIRLRPHHIFCHRFLPLHLLARGEEFAQAIREIDELIRSGGERIIVFNEGPDQLCLRCPDYNDGRCRHPLGDEEKVRRWDARILQGLDVSYGDMMAVKDLLALIDEKAPLDFCRTRCPWKEVCSVPDE